MADFITFVAGVGATPPNGMKVKTTLDAIGNVQHVNIDGITPEIRQHTTTVALPVTIGPGDPISGLPVVIDYDHHQLHEGEIFIHTAYVASLGANANKDLLLVVPDIAITRSAVAQCPHLRFEFVTGSGGIAYLYEAPTVTANGAAQTPVAMERNGTYASQMKVYDTPTVTAVGTLLWQGLMVAIAKSGAVNSSTSEFVLRNNTTYLLRLTSAAAANQVLMRAIWYEDQGV